MVIHADLVPLKCLTSWLLLLDNHSTFFITVETLLFHFGIGNLQCADD
jgi:hypothetical protein